MSSSSSSLSSNPQWLYDVFINFRENHEGGTNSFISRLRSVLSRRGISNFNKEKGVDSSVAIEGSHIALIVFTKNYSDSIRCLDELVKIMDCHNDCGQVVVPIFYHVDRSDVREQKGTFGEALDELSGKRFPGKGVVDVLLKWGGALTQASLLTGWDITDDCRDEAEQVEEIVNDVLKKLDSTLLPVAKFPVGLESRVQRVIDLIKNQSGEAFLVGIYGMSGSGKTTLAKAIYNKMYCEFENRSFIENISQVWEQGNKGCIHLQKQLLSDVLKTKVKVHSIAMGTTLIERKLQWKRALIILDGMTKFEQLEALCGNRKWIGSGSVLIITTTDSRILTSLRVAGIFQMIQMNENESLELFSWHAFRKVSPRKDFFHLSRGMIHYCQGLPLALEVLGSYFCDQTKEEWEGVWSNFKRTSIDQVRDILKISYDGLDDEEKKIFLDICCFFVGKDRAYVTKILNECRFYPKIGISILAERNLVKVKKNNKLGMHDMLLHMGREIISDMNNMLSMRDTLLINCESSSKEAEKDNQLWVDKDVLDVLTKHNLGMHNLQPDMGREIIGQNSLQEAETRSLLPLLRGKR